MEKNWKTCEICEKMFVPYRSSQRFCPECGKHPDVARRRIKQAERINRARVGDGLSKPQKRICKECGKEYYSFYGGSYCSRLCSYSARTAKTTCPVCGKNLLELGIESGRDVPCSPECRKQYEIQRAKATGRYKTCQQCGKMFIAHDKSGKFCSRQCYQAYEKTAEGIEARRSRARKNDDDAEALKRTCQYCGKIYFLCESWTSGVFCSETCRENAKPKRDIPSCRAVEAFAVAVQEKKNEADQRISSRKNVKERATKNLCLECKTSQKECERFTSGFVYCPDGAVVKQVRGRPIVVSCPKFLEGKKKKKR